jgi:hypothetical protein
VTFLRPAPQSGGRETKLCAAFHLISGSCFAFGLGDEKTAPILFHPEIKARVAAANAANQGDEFRASELSLKRQRLLV